MSALASIRPELAFLYVTSELKNFSTASRFSGKPEGSENRHRWETAAKDEALDHLRKLPLIQTAPEDLLKAVKDGTVSTNG